MPGIHLNKTEKKLKELWNNSDFLYLKKISINDATPIRGLKKCEVEFQYPITVFCGKNGSGKSTFLQLAALAFHSKEKGKSFTFSSFFKRSKYDASNDDTKLSWYYSGKDKKGGKSIFQIDVHKGKLKWMHYERRPEKDVILLPVSRVLPDNEKNLYNIITRIEDKDFNKLNNKYLKYLCYIMGKEYSEVDDYQGVFSKCNSNNCQYSSYNMGIGEKVLCYILYILQEAKEQSLIVIDEIEMGLHPEALSNLAEVLQKIVLEKKLQVFITSHSRDFLDALPREARIVVERVGKNIMTINNPTTIYAISRISEKKMEEMVIYCEDDVAQDLISMSLGQDKIRVICACVGSKTELLKAVHYHIVNHDPRKYAVIWDGDVKDNEIDTYFKSISSLEKDNVPYIKLPGDIAPEEWIIKMLDNDKGYKELSSLFGVSTIETQRLLEKARTVSDCHDIFFTIGNEILEESKYIQKYCCKALLQVNLNILDNIKNFIINQLNKKD